MAVSIPVSLRVWLRLIIAVVQGKTRCWRVQNVIELHPIIVNPFGFVPGMRRYDNDVRTLGWLLLCYRSAMSSLPIIMIIIFIIIIIITIIRDTRTMFWMRVKALEVYLKYLWCEPLPCLMHTLWQLWLHDDFHECESNVGHRFRFCMPLYGTGRWKGMNLSGWCTPYIVWYKVCACWDSKGIQATSIQIAVQLISLKMIRKWSCCSVLNSIIFLYNLC